MMRTKNDIHVNINGRTYTMCGYESEEYLKQIAHHINDKIEQFKKEGGYTRLDPEMKQVLLDINLADEYYKVKKRVDEVKEQRSNLEQTIFDMKHQMIEQNAQMEELRKQVENLEKENFEKSNRIVRLETELEEANKKPKNGRR